MYSSIEISQPVLFFNGIEYDDNSFIQDSLSVDTEYMFMCRVPDASPEPDIRWLKNGDIDMSVQAIPLNHFQVHEKY